MKPNEEGRGCPSRQRAPTLPSYSYLLWGRRAPALHVLLDSSFLSSPSVLQKNTRPRKPCAPPTLPSNVVAYEGQRCGGPSLPDSLLSAPGAHAPRSRGNPRQRYCEEERGHQSPLLINTPGLRTGDSSAGLPATRNPMVQHPEDGHCSLLPQGAPNCPSPYRDGTLLLIQATGKGVWGEIRVWLPS